MRTLVNFLPLYFEYDIIWYSYRVNFLQNHIASHSITFHKQNMVSTPRLVPGNAKIGDGGAEAIAKGLNRGPKAIVWLQLQDWSPFSSSELREKWTCRFMFTRQRSLTPFHTSDDHVWLITDLLWVASNQQQQWEVYHAKSEVKNPKRPHRIVTSSK